MQRWMCLAFGSGLSSRYPIGEKLSHLIELELSLSPKMRTFRQPKAGSAEFSQKKPSRAAQSMRSVTAMYAGRGPLES